MNLTPLKKREEAQVARLRVTAEQLGTAVLTSTTIAASRTIMQALARNEGLGPLGEPAADLRRLRTDPPLATALERDLRIARHQTALLLLDAMALGYTTEVEGQAEQYAHVRVNVSVSNAELAGYPVAGHAPPEIVDRLIATLRYEIDGALAAPLTGAIDPAAIPAALGAVAAAHGARVGAAVEEAYYAATGAGMKALGAALIGVP